MSGCQVGGTPSQITGVATGAAVNHETPAKEAVLAFVEAFNKRDLDGMVRCVQGAKNSEPLRKLFATEPNIPTIIVTVTGETPTATGAVVTLTSRYVSKPPSTPEAERKEDVVLIKEGGDWKIVPLKNPSSEPGFVVGIATIVSQPEMVFSQAKSAAKKTSCLSNIKQIALGMLLYMNDHDDKFPKTTVGLETVLNPYLKNNQLWKCPEDTGTGPSYAFNPALAGKNATAIEQPAMTVMAYEGKEGKLAYRHRGMAAVAFTDGHAKMFTAENAKTLRWTIK